MPDQRTIMVVEDNPDSRTIYSIVLKHSGYHVMEAADGETALEMVKFRKPDLILLDISLPKMDGYAVATQLKSDARTRDIPIIALTAHVFVEDRERAIEVGCDGYLTKPIEPRRVLQEVKRYLQLNPPA